jgi:hypothetical protein
MREQCGGDRHLFRYVEGTRGDIYVLALTVGVTLLY